MNMARLIFIVLSLVNRLLGLFQNWHIQRQARKVYHNEQIAIQTENTRRANKARRDVRNAAGNRPDQRLQDDGFRRD